MFGPGYYGRETGLTLLLLAANALVGPSPSEGQIGRTVGIHVGRVESRQLWTGTISTEAVGGFSLGLNVDVPTPLPVLSVQAELAYVRRGSMVWDEESDPLRLSAVQVRSHYLSVPILGKLRFRLGPASAYVVAGPTIDQLLETQCTEGFCRVLNDERPTVFSLAVGSGISLDLRDRVRGELEVRLLEGVTDAYVSGLSGVRYRTVEVLVRACFPF